MYSFLYQLLGTLLKYLKTRYHELQEQIDAEKSAQQNRLPPVKKTNYWQK